MITPTAAVSALIVGVPTLAVGASVFAAGMAQWGPGDWAAFAGTVLTLVGGLYALRRKDREDAEERRLKAEADQVRLRTEVRRDVQSGVTAAADVAARAADVAAHKLEAAVAAVVPPEQLEELAERVAAKLLAKMGPPATLPGEDAGP